MSFENFKKYVDKMNKIITDKLKDNEEELAFYTNLVKRFNDICEENKQLKEIIDRTINDINLAIDIIKQQPSEDDSWILDRLNGFKFLLVNKGEYIYGKR